MYVYYCTGGQKIVCKKFLVLSVDYHFLYEDYIVLHCTMYIVHVYVYIYIIRIIHTHMYNVCYYTSGSFSGRLS